MKYRLGDLSVDAHPTSWVAPTATVIGKVHLGVCSRNGINRTLSLTA